MIPRSWKNKVRAPRGKILVDRDPVQSIRHGLFVPDSYLDHTKTATGTVVDIFNSFGLDEHGGPYGYRVGDQVLLSVTGGVQLVFGLGGLEGETELWMFDEQAVKLVFDEARPVEAQKEHILRHERHRLAVGSTTDDGKWVEGDREGLR